MYQKLISLVFKVLRTPLLALERDLVEKLLKSIQSLCRNSRVSILFDNQQAS
jgi:hypothetical protein